jgi:hypothetical protein
MVKLSDERDSSVAVGLFADPHAGLGDASPALKKRRDENRELPPNYPGTMPHCGRGTSSQERPFDQSEERFGRSTIS